MMIPNIQRSTTFFFSSFHLKILDEYPLFGEKLCPISFVDHCFCAIPPFTFQFLKSDRGQVQPGEANLP